MENLQAKIGQMLLLGFRGLKLGDEDAIVRDIRELNLGGVLLFDRDVALNSPVRNVESPAQVRALTDSLQDLSEIPLLIAVDQEGGQVARFKEQHGFPAARSARQLGDLDDPGETRRQAEQTAGALAEVGCNVNFSPCVDLDTNPENPIIGGMERSYGADPDRVIRHAREVIRAHQKKGIACAPKHFPGHGSSEADTHLGFVDVTETWSETELKPFGTFLRDGECWAVMTAHVFHAKLDPEWPATLSARVIGGLLRDTCNFEGVVFTDDMEMGAISSRYGLETALLQAIRAGVDILTFANNVVYQPNVGQKAVGIIERFVADGTISEERIDQSYRRILALKRKMGIV